LRMAIRAGASLGMMKEAWWMTSVELPGETFLGAPRSVFTVFERTLPGSIMVNREGQRFANEASNYNALGGALHQFDPTSFSYRNLPCWLIFDAEYLTRYGFFGAGVVPGGPAPEWMTRAASITELASAIGVPADEPERTVARFNEHAAAGRDLDFKRGESPYDQFNGDLSQSGARTTRGPIDTAPFYAVELHRSALGTKGGPRTDRNGRVLSIDGDVIEGLFAAGNTMACVTGMAYAGAGGTLGPAMVFGFRAGRAAASRSPVGTSAVA